MQMMENPGYTERFYDIVQNYNRQILDMVLEVEPDIIQYHGWYDTPNYWGPKHLRAILAPRIQELAVQAHAGGSLFCYLLPEGYTVYRNTLRDMDVDVFLGLEPLASRKSENLAAVKAALGDHHCIWGGVNAPVTVGMGTEREIDAAVRTKIRSPKSDRPYPECLHVPVQQRRALGPVAGFLSSPGASGSSRRCPQGGHVMGEFSASFNAAYYGRLFAAHGPMPRTMDQFSFDFGDPFYDFASFQFAARLFTMDNTYGVDPECCTVERQPGSLPVRAAGLRCAGGQQRAQGSMLLHVRQVNGADVGDIGHCYPCHRAMQGLWHSYPGPRYLCSARRTGEHGTRVRAG